MLRPLTFAISLRYTRAKKRSYFVSFISLMSMVGIALGVAVLITVLSVMNGFDHEIHHRFFSMAPEITVSDPQNKMDNWQEVAQQATGNQGVVGAAPYIGGQGLMSSVGQVLPVIITGILPEQEKHVIDMKSKMIAGSLDKLNNFGIVLGQGLAQRLGVFIGDKVTVMIPKATVTLAGMIPRFKRFTVIGIFKAGSGFNFDSKLSFIHLTDAQKLFQLGQGVTGVRLKISDVYAAPGLAHHLREQLLGQYAVGDWTEQFGAFFQAVKMEKTMMFFILVLIIAVAAFNLVSSLVMIVKDKQAEIAILRTLGATPKMIMVIFLMQGLLVGLIGTSIGLLLGLLLAYNVTDLVNFLQSYFNVTLLSSNVYFVDFLPSKVHFTDVLRVAFVAVSMSFLATLYPAYQASKTQPAEALRYE